MTAFEKLVFKKVGQIPLGKVTTYQLIAKSLGKPKAARAVGNALNKNPWLVKIPCHRAVGTDGSLGGYRLGQKRKKQLLQKERIEFRANRIQDLKKYLYK